MLEEQSKTAIEEYELQAKCNALIPRKTGLFRRRNTLMKILDEKIAQWFYEFLIELRGEAPSDEEPPETPQPEPVTVEEVTPEEAKEEQAESSTRTEEKPQSGGELVEAGVAYMDSVSETKKQ